MSRISGIWLVPLLVTGGAASAAPGEIASVLISRTAGTADVEIRFACPNRLVSRPAPDAAGLNEIILLRTGDCPAPGTRINEATRPPGRELAALDEIGYTAEGGDNATLRLRFTRTVRVTADQTGDLRGLSVHVQVVGGPASEAPPPLPLPVPPPAGRSALTPEQIARAEERARLAMQPRATSAAAAPDFVINLRSSTIPVSVGAETAGLAHPGQVVYVNELTIDGQAWYRLRLGFYATEADANAVLATLRPRFPEAWVTRVQAAERQASGVALPDGTGAGMGATVAAGAKPLTDAQAKELLADARGAIIDQDYPVAIDLATRLLSAPSRADSAEARELLGLARERSGQAPQAVAEYQRYIADYPDGDGAERVRQRLAALTTAREQPRESIRGTAAARDSDWDVYGGISQFFRRDSLDFGGSAGSVDQSGIFTDADVVVRHTGERLDMESRATVGYTYDMSSGGPGIDNQGRVYNLYLDLNDQGLGLSTRLGRQTLRNQGVLGRFDGGIVSWQWAPSYRLNLLAGYPVYFPDDSIDTSRTFYGASIDVLNLLDLFDVNLFVNVQDVDGINDRQAVGAELRYFGGNRSLITTVEYDYGYSELNSIVAMGNWTFDNRLTVNGRFDWRNNPYLTTESALIGQQAGSIQDLLLIYSEAEIRQLALDRSGAMHSIALGVSRPLSARFEISADVTASQYDGTPASGGVQDTQDSGTLIYSYVSLIGNSLFREGDSSILGLRYSDGGPSRSAAIFLDSRFPLNQNLRLNPKLLVSRREMTTGDVTDLLVRPGLRVLYRVARQFRVEVEAGGEFGSHDSGSDTNNSTGYYLYAGYSADF